MRLEESRRFSDPYARRQYEIIRDDVEKVLTELLEMVDAAITSRPEEKT